MPRDITDRQNVFASAGNPAGKQAGIAVRALKLSNGFSDILYAVKALAEELDKRPAQGSREQRRTELVENAYWHLQEAKRALFKAASE